MEEYSGLSFRLTSKQMQVLVEVNNSRFTGVEEIFLIGAIGTSKTFAMAYAHACIAFNFPKSIIPVARKDMAEAGITTWPVYTECLDRMGMKEDVHYTLRQASNDLRIRFSNGSIVQFIGLNKSHDRNWSKAKVTSTAAGVDEIDDVEEDGYDVLFSRTGRRNSSGAPRIMISCCNPNDKWIKYKVYLPWLKREGKRLPGLSDEEWDAIEPLDPKKVVIEFDMEDSFLFEEGYYDRFQTRSVAWRQRNLLNNWNYLDDEQALFKSRAMEIATIHRLKKDEKFIAIDPNAGGKDRAALVLFEGDVLVEMEVYSTEDLERLARPDERNPFNPGAILGRLTETMMNREDVPPMNVGGDIVGIGQGWLTYMLSNGHNVLQFRSGDAPMQTPYQLAHNIKPPYRDLRSQMFAEWAFDIQNGNVFFYADCPHLSQLKKELMLHEGDTSDKVMGVTKKDDIKKLLGKSPDIADAGMMAYWVRKLRRGSVDAANDRPSVGLSVDELYNNSNGF